MTATIIEIVILLVIPTLFALGFLGFIDLGWPEDWWIAGVLEVIIAVLVLLVRSFL
jgi:hypothetical protein